MAKFYVGLDLGQSNDYTAVSVLEHVGDAYHVRHLERVRGLPYPVIVAKVGEIMQSPALAGQAALVVDQTGVGATGGGPLHAGRPQSCGGDDSRRC